MECVITFSSCAVWWCYGHKTLDPTLERVEKNHKKWSHFNQSIGHHNNSKNFRENECMSYANHQSIFEYFWKKENIKFTLLKLSKSKSNNNFPIKIPNKTEIVKIEPESAYQNESFD